MSEFMMVSNLDPERGLKGTLRALDKALVSWAMSEADGNQGTAAKLLKIPRTTLQSKLKIHKLLLREGSRAKQEIKTNE